MNFVLGIIGILIGAFGVICITQSAREKEGAKSVVNRGKLFILLGIAVLIFSASFKIIPTGYTGVRTTFGQISSETVPNGFNWKIPFVQSIQKVNNKQPDIVFEDKVWSETSARTAIYYNNITVTYQINPERSAWIYANVSNYEDSLVSNALVSSAIKAASKELSDVEATDRSKIEPLSAKRIQEALDDKYGPDVVTINKVVIKSADFEDSYNEAVAKKQKAQLEAEQQEIENKKNVAKAEADAKAKLTKAEAEAKANKMLEKSLTDQVLKDAQIKKWDGKMPSVVSGDSNGFMVSVK